MARTEEIDFDPPIDGGVVVGHDGSATASAALTWAVEEARLRRLPLHVVRAWQLTTAIAEVAHAFGTVPSYDECATAMGDALTAALDRVDTSDVRVVPHVVHGAIARVVLAASHHADLLVVGERGAGGFVGLRLGSVAEQAVRHSPATVVVVR